jgi:hypothetical protein
MIRVLKPCSCPQGDLNHMVLNSESSRNMDSGEVASKADVPRQLMSLIRVNSDGVRSLSKFSPVHFSNVSPSLCIVIGMGVKEGGGS